VIVLEFLTWIVVAVFALPCAVLTLECLAAQLPGLRPRRTTGEPRPRTVCLIPAHDEERVVPTALASVLPQMQPGDRVVVVAHNCSDGTAEVARQHGAEVLVVRDRGDRGKPAAVEAGLRALQSEPPEVVVIVDADCRAAEGAIESLVRAVQRTGAPVQARYLFAPSAHDQASISSLALLVKNFVRPLGLSRLGLPCLLNGAGSAYPFDVLCSVPHGRGSIAEDYQLAVDLARRGRAPRFCPEALVESVLPADRRSAWGQRRRWEHGHVSLALRAPSLLAEALRRRRPGLAVLALDLLVLPLSLLCLTGLATLVLTSIVGAVGGYLAPLGALLVTGAITFTAMLLAWLRFAGRARTLAALRALPRYVVWKVPLYLAYARDREKKWTKTGRDRDAA